MEERSAPIRGRHRRGALATGAAVAVLVLTVVSALLPAGGALRPDEAAAACTTPVVALRTVTGVVVAAANIEDGYLVQLRDAAGVVHDVKFPGRFTAADGAVAPTYEEAFDGELPVLGHRYTVTAQPVGATGLEVMGYECEPGVAVEAASVAPPNSAEPASGAGSTSHGWARTAAAIAGGVAAAIVAGTGLILVRRRSTAPHA